MGNRKDRVHRKQLDRLMKGFGDPLNWNSHNSDEPDYPDVGMFECEATYDNNEGEIYISRYGYGKTWQEAELSATMAVRVELITILDAEIHSIEEEKKSEPA